MDILNVSLVAPVAHRPRPASSPGQLATQLATQLSTQDRQGSVISSASNCATSDQSTVRPSFEDLTRNHDLAFISSVHHKEYAAIVKKSRRRLCVTCADGRRHTIGTRYSTYFRAQSTGDDEEDGNVDIPCYCRNYWDKMVEKDMSLEEREGLIHETLPYRVSRLAKVADIKASSVSRSDQRLRDAQVYHLSLARAAFTRTLNGVCKEVGGRIGVELDADTLLVKLPEAYRQAVEKTKRPLESLRRWSREELAARDKELNELVTKYENEDHGYCACGRLTNWERDSKIYANEEGEGKAESGWECLGCLMWTIETTDVPLKRLPTGQHETTGAGDADLILALTPSATSIGPDFGSDEMPAEDIEVAPRDQRIDLDLLRALRAEIDHNNYLRRRMALSESPTNPSESGGFEESAWSVLHGTETGISGMESILPTSMPSQQDQRGRSTLVLDDSYFRPQLDSPPHTGSHNHAIQMVEAHSQSTTVYPEQEGGFVLDLKAYEEGEDECREILER